MNREALIARGQHPAAQLGHPRGVAGDRQPRATKRIIHESQDWPQVEFFDRQQPIAEAVRSSDDAREGARAFVERRAPQWTGR